MTLNGVELGFQVYARMPAGGFEFLVRPLSTLIDPPLCGFCTPSTGFYRLCIDLAADETATFHLGLCKIGASKIGPAEIGLLKIGMVKIG